MLHVHVQNRPYRGVMPGARQSMQRLSLRFLRAQKINNEIRETEKKKTAGNL
jgi:hypothetical protein